MFYTYNRVTGNCLNGMSCPHQSPPPLPKEAPHHHHQQTQRIKHHQPLHSHFKMRRRQHPHRLGLKLKLKLKPLQWYFRDQVLLATVTA